MQAETKKEPTTTSRTSSSKPDEQQQVCTNGSNSTKQQHSSKKQQNKRQKHCGRSKAGQDWLFNGRRPYKHPQHQQRQQEKQHTTRKASIKQQQKMAKKNTKKQQKQCKHCGRSKAAIVCFSHNSSKEARKIKAKRCGAPRGGHKPGFDGRRSKSSNKKRSRISSKTAQTTSQKQ